MWKEAMKYYTNVESRRDRAMFINEFGSRDNPTMVLLAPMMVSGPDLYNLMKPNFKGDYHLIALDQGAHGKAGRYHSAEEEYQTLRSFLLEIGCTGITLVYGASLKEALIKATRAVGEQILVSARAQKPREYFVYFKVFVTRAGAKFAANRARGFIQRFLKEVLTGTYLAALVIMIAGTALVVADTLARHHAHDHQHSFTHTHDGCTHTHTVTHSHEHNHYVTDGKHGHHHTKKELERLERLAGAVHSDLQKTKCRNTADG